MTNKALNPISDKSLNDAINGIVSVSEWWFDEASKVSMMPDKRIENALLKLQGLGKTSYNAEPELRSRWIWALRLEQMKRADEARASFEKAV